MLGIKKLHHIAIICSDYKKSKVFYTEILGFKIINETYREDRQSYKLDLSLNDQYVVELFSFVNPPVRVSCPEACGLRHIAFAVENIDLSIAFLVSQNIPVESVRLDNLTGKKFTFFADPDELPIELYEK